MSSPAVADGKVFVGSTAGTWPSSTPRRARCSRRCPPPGGVIAAPAVANGAVYFSTFDGKLTKIDLAGKVVWTFDGGRLSITEFAVRGTEILFFAGTGNTVVYHLRDEGARSR